MIFKGSKFEDRYNEFWNASAVSADKTIREMMSVGLLKLQEGQYFLLLNKYAISAKSIISNLKRQSTEMFDDKEYVANYLQTTVDSTREDFSYFRARLARSYGEKSLCVDFIDMELKNIELLMNDNERTYDNSQLKIHN